MKHLNRAAEASICWHELTQAMDYNPHTGIATWNKRPGTDGKTNRWNAQFAGKPCGGNKRKGNGYYRIKVQGHTFYAHRLFWFYVNKTWPTNILDHVNRNKADNRMDNLRESNHSLNRVNMPAKSRTGLRNIYTGDGLTFKVMFTRNGKFVYGGKFNNLQDAIVARNLKALELDGILFQD